MVTSYKIIFISYTLMSVLNLAIVLYEIKDSPSLLTLTKMISNVGLYLVVAYAYYIESKRKEEFQNLKKRINVF